MSSTVDYLELCRLCLVKENVSLPIFEDEGDARQMFFKISACLPVKVAREDKLPKKICDDCGYKVELLYQFWNTSINAEKQLLQWLGEVGGLEDKQGYTTQVLNPHAMKQERSVGNIDINMIDNMSIITMPAGSEQQFTTVPIDGNGTVQTVQVVAGSSAQSAHEQMAQSQGEQEDEEDEEEDNYDDGCDNDDSMAVKEEAEEDQSERSLEPTFVNVSLPCDEAGPSGLQQKISDMSEITLQTADGDPKPGYFVAKLETLTDVELQQVSSNYEVAVLPPAPAAASSGTASPDDGNLFECALCGDAFSDEGHFEYHRKSLHEGLHQEVIHQEEVITDETKVLMYACERCPGTFPDELSYQRHQHTAHSDETDQAQVSTSSDLKLFTCEHCPATYRYRQGLRLHAKTHQPGYVEPEKKYPCPICSKRFVRRQVMIVHMRTHGDSSVPPNEHKCSVCGKVVSSKTYLTVHMRKHTGEKPFRCDICGAGYISQNYLSVHRRTHTGEKPHYCLHCGKSFSQRTTMIVHERRHTGVKPYACQQCPKAFASKTMLNSHLKTHAKQSARAEKEREAQMQLQQQQQQQQNQQQEQQQSVLLTPPQEEVVGTLGPEMVIVETEPIIENLIKGQQDGGSSTSSSSSDSRGVRIVLKPAAAVATEQQQQRDG